VAEELADIAERHSLREARRGGVTKIVEAEVQ
jgi:hypothetical protein